MENTTKYLPAEERRAMTVQAVLTLAESQNPGEITTAAIARKMNLTQGAVFRHFATKADLWQAVMAWVRERLLARIEQASSENGSPLATLEAMFITHVDFVVEYPGVPRIFFDELQRSEDTPAKRIAQELFQQYLQRLCACIDQGKACREITPALATRSAALLFLGTLQGLIMQSMLSGGIEHIRKEAPGVFAIYLRGLRGDQ
jgi:AcrR family transcriptional regulator